MQWGWLEIYCNIANQENEEESAKQVGPHIDGLIVYHEEGLESQRVRLEVYSVASD